MRNSDPARLLWMFVQLLVTATNVHQNPAILLQFGNKITAVHACIVHTIRIPSSDQEQWKKCVQICWRRLESGFSGLLRSMADCGWATLAGRDAGAPGALASLAASVVYGGCKKVSRKVNGPRLPAGMPALPGLWLRWRPLRSVAGCRLGHACRQGCRRSQGCRLRWRPLRSVNMLECCRLKGHACRQGCRRSQGLGFAGGLCDP